MQSRSAPIGFEGLTTDQKKIFIGFEQYEDEQKEPVIPAYPLGMFFFFQLSFNFCISFY
jgi:hypothetical protein